MRKESDFKCIAEEVATDLVNLWHNLECDGRELYGILKKNEIKRIMGLTILEDGYLNIDNLMINVKAGGRVVYYPPNTDLKNEHFSKFYLSLSEEDKEGFLRMFGAQVTEFFTKRAGKKLN